MSNRIILITRRFPFFKTEAFLEAEINFLGDGFKNVLIVPSEIGSEVRTVPANVEIDKEFSFHFQNKKKRAMQTFFSNYFWKTIIRHRHKINGVGDILRIFQFVSSVICYEKYFGKFLFKTNDLIYTYWFAEATCAFMKIKNRTKVNFKIISRAHRYDLYEGLPSTPKFWPYRSLILKQIDRLFPISENGKKYIESRYDVKGKVELSKLGVFDRNQLAPDVEDSNTLYIVSVSRIDPMKRVEFIADCVMRLAKDNPDKEINWTHFGDGPNLHNIKKSISHLPNLNTFLNGAVPNTHIYKYYEEKPVTIFINLSSSEGIPVSIMEAQSFGIPVIATDVGGSGEIVTKETGLLLTSHPSEEEVVSAINQLLEANLDRASVKAVWQKNFNANTNYKAFVKRLREIQSS